MQAIDGTLRDPRWRMSRRGARVGRNGVAHLDALGLPRDPGAEQIGILLLLNKLHDGTDRIVANRGYPWPLRCRFSLAETRKAPSHPCRMKIGEPMHGR